VDDAGALQDPQRVGRIEAGEAVAGKQRPVDFLLAVLPAAPAGDGGEKCVDALALELLADHLFVPRAGPDRIPLAAREVVHGAGGAACSCFRPSSNAFRTSSFFHSMIACARSFSRYFWNSALRLSVNTRSLICSRACSSVIVSAEVIASSLRIW